MHDRMRANAYKRGWNDGYKRGFASAEAEARAQYDELFDAALLMLRERERHA